jgi:hypothetical protein
MRRYCKGFTHCKGFMVVGVALMAAWGAAPTASAGERTRTVRPILQRAGVAVFKPAPALAARTVAGRVVTGAKRKKLSRAQVTAITGRGVLRVKLPPRPRPLLVLHLRSRTAAPAAGVEISVSGATVAKPTPTPGPPGSAFNPLADGRLYSSSSPFNQPLPTNPAIDPASPHLVQGLAKAAARKGFVLTVGEWTVPTYFASAETPTTTVELGGAPPQWEMAPDARAYPPGSHGGLPRSMPSQLRGVPIPLGAQPDPALDAHMTIVDLAAGCEYDLYGAHLAEDGWHAVWANSTRIDGNGIYPAGLGAKASGFASLAGLIWPEELRKGEIDHALFFAYPFTRSGGPVSPATASDGRVEGADALPEGARLQLDPDLDLDQLGLTPYQRTIAEAMQTYGIILGDTGGAFGLYAVGRQGLGNDPYGGLLPADDFPTLDRIPINRFRVVDLPAQKPEPPLRIEASGCGTFAG